MYLPQNEELHCRDYFFNTTLSQYSALDIVGVCVMKEQRKEGEGMEEQVNRNKERGKGKCLYECS